MSGRLYTKTNQLILDAAVIAVSLFLAYAIRYDGSIPHDRVLQLLIVVPIVTAGRLLAFLLFGIERIPWRHISIRDVFRIGEAQLSWTLILLALRYAPIARLHLVQLPIGVIVVEFLLSLSGVLGIRMLRRCMYEAREISQSGTAARSRRLLLVGAGRAGARVAKEMALHPSVRIVGFLDDDRSKTGCVIAGAKVLGPVGMLAELAQKQAMDEILVCIPPESRGSFNRFAALLEKLPITSKFVPTIDEIIESKDGLHLSVAPANGASNGNGNGFHAREKAARDAGPRKSEIRGKKILITGGAGFIGSNLAERLAGANEIVLLDRTFHDQPVQFTSLRSNSSVRIVEQDILDGGSIESLARNAEIVIHAAAIVGVGRVCSHPRETLETNFSGTSRILKALERNTRLERFLYFSTSEVFGVNSFRVQENAPSLVGPAVEARWSYAIAKLAGEHLVQAYYRQAGTPVVTVRPFNVFGPRRLGAHAVKSFILSALMGNPIEVHGDGSQIRSWCFISDFCDALIEMMARPEAIGQDFNIGNPANTLTVLQLAQQVAEMTRTSSEIQFSGHPFPDIEIRVPSLAKASAILDYKPVFDITRGLEATIDWYQEHLPFFEPQLAKAAANL